ncbi:histidine kinase N-terminal 7TM domain-containing protein [Methanocella arvoryzae]|uniref:Signal transduction histidine kinase n=1 Tax=Methanocella arvoryzae (strain DSM 22066 / NBRC 105507 / MRE50) TaxID=351160 RepID=Q0W3W1_METAR|nr:histidine kinase N-terminal 7TM domain-containing protein [Methanocella arvoryzae]CAJ36932.1 putative signal transduction histidine kinase [Methanocella arvoryzae MRE50]
MILELSFYSITLFATAALMSLVALYVWKRRSVPGGTYFALLMAASAEWAFAGALEYAAADVSTEIMFARLTYVGAMAILPLWLLFILDYSNPGRRISWKLNTLLWTLPATLVALVFTNDYHGLIWSSIVQVNTETGYILIYNKGIAFWAILLYSIAVVVPGLALLIRKAIGGSKDNRYLTVTVLTGSVFIALSSIVSEFGQSALRGTDITPFAFAIIGLAVSWGIYRYHIFELMPVATEKLVENMADGILVLNLQEEIVKVNSAARQMLGITDTAIGHKVEKAVAVWPHLARHITYSGRRSFEVTIGPKWIEASVSGLQDKKDRTIGTLIVLRDVTEQKQAQEALRLSEARYKTMVETASEGICILDKEDRVAFINKKASDLTGFTPEEACGRSAYDFIGSEYHEALRKNLALKRLGITEQYDYRLNCKDGNSVWVIASASPLYDEKGEFMATLAMLTDITDRKYADEQLKISLKEKEALLKEVHHRVKNNLQIITSLLNLQSTGMDDPKYTGMIRDSQNRIKSMALVHEQLYKSRDLSNIDIAEYLNSLINNISRSYNQASGRVTLRTDIETINVDIDRAVPIGIIVTELVSNAYKYAFPEAREGEIWVELRRDGGKIMLTISDNGVGLPEGLEIGKTGTLGLQLVEMLTQQIDGELEIGKGERTEFKITINH